MLEALQGDRGVQVIGRCNSAQDLVPRVEQDQADVLVLDDDLHLLDAERLQDLTRRRRVPVVLLVHDPDAARWRSLRAVVLPWTAAAADVLTGVDRAVRRDFARNQSGGDARREPLASAGDAEASATGGTRVIALFGGAGAPGRTTLGVNLLAVLGASRRAVLVDLDLTGSAVAAHLRAVHPAWNIVDLALAHPRTPEGWDQILEGRLQPIGSFSRGARVLCGVARPQQRANITPAFVEGLVGQLRERFDHVLLDLGDEPLSDSGREAMVAAAALGAADHVLLVAAADPLSVHHAQLARDEAAGVLDLERTSLVVNRCDSSEDASSSSAALRLPLVCSIPSDPRVRLALALGQPAVCDARSRLRRPVGQLAGRIAEAVLDAPILSSDGAQRDRLAPVRSLLAPLSSVLGGVRG